MPRHPVGEPLQGCKFFVDYQANNGRVQAVICQNNTPHTAHGFVISPSTGTRFERTFPPNTPESPETSQNIPAGQINVRVRTDEETQQQYLAGVDSGGNDVNLEYQFSCPYIAP